MKPAYYNEIDKYVAQWLRNLIAAGHIAPGDVDERSIEDVCPTDLLGYTQCHFFAGIGVWSYALRQAGWPDDRQVWTGSCPCQPFSAAGKGAGFADERHLWPAFFHLIKERRPASILGEQVASKDADPWIDLVQDDLEALGYAFGAVPFPSAGVGAPHIRDRLYWVADANGAGSLPSSQPGVHRRKEGARSRHGESERLGAISRLDDANNKRLEGLGRGHQAASGRIATIRPIAEAGESGGVADPNGRQFEGFAIVRGLERNGQDAGRPQGGGEPESCGNDGGMGNAFDEPRKRNTGSVFGAQAEIDRQGQPDGGGSIGFKHASASMGGPSSGPTNGYWRDADWLFCRDGKWRPVEPGTFPLAHGASARVGRLRAYGNSINPWQAAEFIRAVMNARDTVKGKAA